MCDLRQRIEQKIDDIRYRVGREIDGYCLLWLTFRIYLDYKLKGESWK